MTSCIGAAPLLSRFAVRRGRRGRFLFLSVLFFFFFCIRWIRSRAHGLESVLTPRSSVLSTHMPQLERTRAAPDVTTRRTSGDAREGRGPGLIIYGTHLSSCYTSRNGGCLFSLTVKHGERNAPARCLPAHNSCSRSRVPCTLKRTLSARGSAPDWVSIITAPPTAYLHWPEVGRLNPPARIPLVHATAA